MIEIPEVVFWGWLIYTVGVTSALAFLIWLLNRPLLSGK